MLYVIIVLQFVLIGIITMVLFNQGQILKAITIVLIYVSILFLVARFALKLHKVKNIFFDEGKYYINSEQKSYLKSDVLKIKVNYLAASYIDFKNGNRYYFLCKPPLKYLNLID